MASSYSKVAVDELLSSVPGDPIAKAAAQRALELAASGKMPDPRALGAPEGIALLRAYGTKYGADALRPVATSLAMAMPPAGASAISMLSTIQSQLAQLRSGDALKLLRSEVKTLTVGQAQQLAASYVADMGLPAVPVQLPSELTPAAVVTAAYASGRKYAENELKAATGIPIKLPAKLTLGELEKSFSALIPDDAAEALEMGLNLGLQYATAAATSAVTSALIGAGVGSVVPGLGTVVGIGVALTVGLLKDEITGLLTTEQPYQRECPTKVRCPTLPQTLSPVDLFPWVVTARKPLAAAIAKDRAKSFCGTGATADCNTTLRGFEKLLYDIVSPTILVLGLQQSERLLTSYNAAPSEFDWFDYGMIKPGGAIVGGTMRVVRVQNFELVWARDALRARIAWLKALHDRASSVATLAPNALDGLRWDLRTELVNAAGQYQLSGGTAETKRWLQTVVDDFNKLQAREANDLEAMRTRYEADKTKNTGCKTYWTAGADSQACTICDDRPRPACAAKVPGLPASAPTVDLGLQCHQQWVAWLNGHPAAAKCFPLAGDAVFRSLCAQALTGVKTPGSAFAEWMVYAAKVCPALRPKADLGSALELFGRKIVHAGTFGFL